MRAVFQSHVFVNELSRSLAVRSDREILHVAGMVAVGTVEAVLLAFGIEMSAGRFEVGGFALRHLMKVQGVFSGRQVVQVEFESYSFPLIPNDDVADRFSLSVLKFHVSFSLACGNTESRKEQTESDMDNGFHAESLLAAGIIVNPECKFVSGASRKGRFLHKEVEYTAKKFEFSLRGERVFMASNAVEPVADQVPADDFQALEEKIYRTIEMYKAARQAQATAERDAQRLRQQLQDRDDELVSLRRESVQLKKEREEIRGRVEKMLEQIETIAEAS